MTRPCSSWSSQDGNIPSLQETQAPTSPLHITNLTKLKEKEDKHNSEVLHPVLV